MGNETNQSNKELVKNYWNAVDGADSIEKFISADCIWHGPDPVGDLEWCWRIHIEVWPAVYAVLSRRIERHLHRDRWQIERPR